MGAGPPVFRAAGAPAAAARVSGTRGPPRGPGSSTAGTPLAASVVALGSAAAAATWTRSAARGAPIAPSWRHLPQSRAARAARCTVSLRGPPGIHTSLGACPGRASRSAGAAAGPPERGAARGLGLAGLWPAPADADPAVPAAPRRRTLRSPGPARRMWSAPPPPATAAVPSSGVGCPVGPPATSSHAALPAWSVSRGALLLAAAGPVAPTGSAHVGPAGWGAPGIAFPGRRPLGPALCPPASTATNIPYRRRANSFTSSLSAPAVIDVGSSPALRRQGGQAAGGPDPGIAWAAPSTHGSQGSRARAHSGQPQSAWSSSSIGALQYGHPGRSRSRCRDARSAVHVAPATSPRSSKASGSDCATRSPCRPVARSKPSPRPPNVPGRSASSPRSTWCRRLSRMRCFSSAHAGCSRHSGSCCPGTCHRHHPCSGCHPSSRALLSVRPAGPVHGGACCSSQTAWNRHWGASPLERCAPARRVARTARV